MCTEERGWSTARPANQPTDTTGAEEQLGPALLDRGQSGLVLGRLQPEAALHHEMQRQLVKLEISLPCDSREQRAHHGRCILGGKQQHGSGIDDVVLAQCGRLARLDSERFRVKWEEHPHR